MVLDPVVLRQLRNTGGDALLGRLFETFRAMAPRRRAAVERALAGTDAVALEKALHSLRSSSAALGARQLAGLAGELEGLAVAGRRDSVSDRWPDLLAELERTLDEMVVQPPGEVAEAAAGTAPARPATEAAPDARPRIALIEDHADIRLLVKALLGGAYEIREYSSGEEALAAIGPETPDLVLLDLSLPRMGGDQVLKRLREMDPGLPVVALTAAEPGTPEQPPGALEFDDWVGKPICSGALCGAVEGLLAGRRPASKNRRR